MDMILESAAAGGVTAAQLPDVAAKYTAYQDEKLKLERLFAELDRDNKGTVEEAIEEFHSKLKTGVFKFSSGSMPASAAQLLCSK